MNLADIAAEVTAQRAIGKASGTGRDTGPAIAKLLMPQLETLNADLERAEKELQALNVKHAKTLADLAAEERRCRGLDADIAEEKGECARLQKQCDSLQSQLERANQRQDTSADDAEMQRLRDEHATAMVACFKAETAQAVAETRLAEVERSLNYERSRPVQTISAPSAPIIAGRKPVGYTLQVTGRDGANNLRTMTLTPEK